MTETVEIGPVDYLVLEFPGTRLTGEGLPMLVDLVDQGIIRILDLVFIRRELDGSVIGMALDEVSADGGMDLTVFEGASSGIVGSDDIEQAGSVLEPGNSAGLLIYENTWAAPFAAAMPRCPGGRERPDPGSGRARRTRRDRTRHDSERGSVGGGATMPLLRGVARTAVIAGTATGVSNRVSRRQANRWAAKDQQSYDEQYQEQPPPPPAAAPAPQGDDMTAKLDQLKQLGELKANGVISDAEFEEQKRRILG
jgi:hypothetical protein